MEVELDEDPVARPLSSVPSVCTSNFAAPATVAKISTPCASTLRPTCDEIGFASARPETHVRYHYFADCLPPRPALLGRPQLVKTMLCSARKLRSSFNEASFCGELERRRNAPLERVGRGPRYPLDIAVAPRQRSRSSR